MMFIVVKWSVLPEHADGWLDTVDEFTQATRSEPGNLFFEWSRSVEDPNVYVLVEAFRDTDAGGEHVRSEHFRDGDRPARVTTCSRRRRSSARRSPAWPAGARWARSPSSVEAATRSRADGDDCARSRPARPALPAVCRRVGPARRGARVQRRSCVRHRPAGLRQPRDRPSRARHRRRRGDGAARGTFLAAGHYAPLLDAVVLRVGHARARPGLIVDLAGGTGYYLGAVLDAAPGRLGVCLDLSAPALRRAARAHPRRRRSARTPGRGCRCATHSAAAVLSVFGPRNVDEVARVLAPGGVLVVASPRPQHLRELVAAARPRRRRPGQGTRVRTRRSRGSSAGARTEVTVPHVATPPDAQTLIAMGPSARHVDAPDIAARVAPLPDPLAVTVAVRVASCSTAR